MQKIKIFPLSKFPLSKALGPKIGLILLGCMALASSAASQAPASVEVAAAVECSAWEEAPVLRKLEDAEAFAACANQPPIFDEQRILRLCAGIQFKMIAFFGAPGLPPIDMCVQTLEVSLEAKDLSKAADQGQWVFEAVIPTELLNFNGVGLRCRGYLEFPYTESKSFLDLCDFAEDFDVVLTDDQAIWIPSNPKP